MDYQIAQRTRYLLQTRVRRLKNAGQNQYQEQLKFFIDFLSSNLVFSSVLSELEGDSILDKDDFITSLGQMRGYDFKNEKQYIHAAYLVLKSVGESSVEHFQQKFMAAFSMANGGARSQAKMDDMLEDINSYWLNYLYEYLDEAIDNRNSILFILKKYKQNGEWFRKNRLIDIAENGAIYGNKGERGLAFDLYETIHNEGIDFNIEPSSASGEVDLIASQTDEDKVILDAKYISPTEVNSAVKNKVVKAFRQVHDYCNDYNTSNGYLLFYLNSEIALDIESEELDGFRVVHINGRNIFFLCVDIFKNSKSASQRGALKRIEIKLSDIQKEE